MRSYATLPSLPEAGPLTRYQDSLAVIVPYARTNLVLNPSLETNTTGYTAVGGSIARSTAQQYHGAYSLAITPTAGTTDGAYYGTVSLTSGTTYAVSCKVYGQPGVAYKLSVATTGGADLAAVTFVGTGRWQWIWLFWTETSTTTRRIYVSKASGTSTAVFYLDGLQVEACGAEGVFVTTYIDGDQPGLVPNQFPPAFGWNGTPHASTSYRSAQTRAGGRIVRFKDFGFLLSAIIGLGLTTPQLQALDYAQLDGAQLQDIRKPARQFSLVGRWTGMTPTQMQTARGQLARLLDRDRTALRQPLALTVQAEEYGAPIGERVTIQGAYSGGLEGETQELPTGAAVATFQQFVPTVYGGDGGSLIDGSLTVSNANRILRRSADGRWGALSTGMVGNEVRALAIAPNGDLYAGGDFTNAGGSGADYIARWDGSAWSVVGSATALNGVVYALAFGPDGTLYVGGAFTNAGGVAAADGIATWNGSAWGALGTGTPGFVYALAVASNGTLYAGGTFSDIGGSGADNLGYWNGSTWAVVGSATSLNAFVAALAFAPNGDLYVGGAFTNADGIAEGDGIARWDGSAWSALGAGLDSGAIAYALAFGSDGTLYVGGDIATAGGQAVSNIASWNGSAWSGLGEGANGPIYALAWTPRGLWAGGQASVVGGVVSPGLDLWNGGTWLPGDVILPRAIRALAVGPDGSLTVGFDAPDLTATAANLTTVTNAGTAAAAPRMVITAVALTTGRLYSLVNLTTGAGLYFNYTVAAGETITLTTEPTNITLVSSFNGNILRALLPGSDVAGFVLQPGANSIALLSTADGVLDWPTRYLSLDDALYQEGAI